MNVSRRFFIGGASAFGAFGAFQGCRFLTDSRHAPDGEPKLRFGVISDIHINCVVGCGEDTFARGSNETFRQTLRWFRSQNVDAVVIAGDMADRGMDHQLLAVADAWYSVFPGDRYPDGRPVEKVFIYGNHDWHGCNYDGGYADKMYPDYDERVKHALQADMGGWWRRAFHEDYSPLYAKSVKGYTFIGQHWDRGCGYPLGDKGGIDPHTMIGPYLAAHGKELDPSLPFFYVQHPHPKDTCYGPWAWGHDDGAATKALAAFPNAIAFSGHSHYSLTDERSVWQGAFTSVGTSSLRYGCAPFDEFGPYGYENCNASGKGKPRALQNAGKLMPPIEYGDTRQGMLWSVYDDCIVVKRRDFFYDLDLDDDWVLPLPTAEARPFAFAERAKKIGAPSFVAGQAAKVERTRAKNRGGNSPDMPPAVEREVYKVTAPQCVPARNARTLDLEFVAECGDVRIVRMVAAEGFDHAPESPRARRRTHCFFNVADFPAGKPVTFTVTPLNCFRRRGGSVTVKSA